MLEILTKAGYDKLRSVRLLGIPTVRKISIEANAVDVHHARIFANNDTKIELEKPSNKYIPNLPILPNDSYVESFVVNDQQFIPPFGIGGDWSISRSKLNVDYTDGSYFSSYFGNPASGPYTDPEIPIIHRATIPPAKGWPAINTEVNQFPIN